MKISSAVAFVVLACGCGSVNGPGTVDRSALRAVALPELSRLEESVQAQLRGRFASLTAKQQDHSVADAELAAGYGEMGMLLLAAEFLEPAEAALINAQTLAPGESRWRYYLGHAYRLTGNLTDASAAFEQALRVAPDDVPAMIALGEAALDRGQPDAAEPFFAKAQSLEPRSAAAHYGRGRAALAKKDYARAAQLLEQALMLDSTASVIHYSLALAYRGMGDVSRAQQHLQQRGSLPLRPDPLRRALDELLDSALACERNADAAGNRGEWADAARYLRKAVMLAPTRAPLHHKLGTALFYLKDQRGAVGEFQEALRLSPGLVDAQYALGVVHEGDGNYRLAIESYAAALESDATHADAQLGLANALRRSGQFERALSQYQRALQLDPGLVRARFGHAASLIRLARYAEARDRLAEAMTLYPSEPAFARAAARLFAAAPDEHVRDGARALAIVRALQGRQPQTIELAETTAMAFAETGQYRDAVQWQQQAIAAAGKAGRHDLETRLADNLARYQAGRPCRMPWRSDEPIEFWL